MQSAIVSMFTTMHKIDHNTDNLNTPILMKCQRDLIMKRSKY